MAARQCTKMFFAVAAVLVIFSMTATAQLPPSLAGPGTETTATFAMDLLAAPFNKPLAKIWYSQTTKRVYQVTVSNEVFRAEWVNIPPAAAKQGAYIRTECRRSGTKWVGSSIIKMLFGVPGAPPGKDTKLCSLTVRFEVDSLTSLKITGHSESLRNFDVKTCHVLQTNWAPFTWVPKE